jgi:hypothetical protein
MARTTAHFTQSEANALETFALTNGLIIEGPQGEKNGEILADFIANKMNCDITAETLAAAFKHVRNQLALKSPEQIGYEDLHAGLSSHEQVALKEFRYGRMKDTYANAYRLLKFLKDRRMPVSERNLQIAAGQLGQALEYDNPKPSREGGYGRYSNTKFEAKDNGDGEFYPNGRRRHSYKPEPAAAASNDHCASADDARWFNLANQLRGRTHAQTEQAMRIVKQDGRSTYEARKKFIEGRGASI